MNKTITYSLLIISSVFYMPCIFTLENIKALLEDIKPVRGSYHAGDQRLEEKKCIYNTNKENFSKLSTLHNEIITPSGYTLLMAACDYKDNALLEKRSREANEAEINSVCDSHTILILLTKVVDTDESIQNLTVVENILQKCKPETITFSHPSTLFTPLHYAVNYTPKFVSLLLEYEPNLLEYKDWQKRTPVDIIIENYSDASKWVKSNPLAQKKCERQMQLLSFCFKKNNNLASGPHIEFLVSIASKINDKNLLHLVNSYQKHIKQKTPTK